MAPGQVGHRQQRLPDVGVAILNSRRHVRPAVGQRHRSGRPIQQAYLSDSGSYRIEGLTLSQGFALADELEDVGKDQKGWEAVLLRWAQGYRADLG
jgi:hypothetical protein